MDPHCFDADPDPDPAQNLDADPDPDPDRGEGVDQPKLCALLFDEKIANCWNFKYYIHKPSSKEQLLTFSSFWKTLMQI